MRLVQESVEALFPFKLFSWGQNTDDLLQFVANSRFHYSRASKVPNSEEGDKTRYMSILLHLQPEEDDWQAGRPATLWALTPEASSFPMDTEQVLCNPCEPSDECLLTQNNHI